MSGSGLGDTSYLERSTEGAEVVNNSCVASCPRLDSTSAIFSQDLQLDPRNQLQEHERLNTPTANGFSALPATAATCPTRCRCRLLGLHLPYPVQLPPPPPQPPPQPPPTQLDRPFPEPPRWMYRSPVTRKTELMSYWIARVCPTARAEYMDGTCDEEDLDYPYDGALSGSIPLRYLSPARSHKAQFEHWYDGCLRWAQHHHRAPAPVDPLQVARQAYTLLASRWLFQWVLADGGLQALHALKHTCEEVPPPDPPPRRHRRKQPYPTNNHAGRRPTRDALRDFYTAVDPSKVRMVDVLAKKYNGQENRLMVAMRAKYRQQPAALARFEQLARELGLTVARRARELAAGEAAARRTAVRRECRACRCAGEAAALAAAAACAAARWVATRSRVHDVSWSLCASAAAAAAAAALARSAAMSAAAGMRQAAAAVPQSRALSHWHDSQPRWQGEDSDELGFPGDGAGFFPGDSSFVDQDLLERAAGLQEPTRTCTQCNNPPGDCECLWGLRWDAHESDGGQGATPDDGGSDDGDLTVNQPFARLVSANRCEVLMRQLPGTPVLSESVRPLPRENRHRYPPLGSVETCSCGVCSRRAREYEQHSTERSNRIHHDVYIRCHGSRRARRARDLWNKHRRANKRLQAAEDRAARRWDAPGACARSSLHEDWDSAARASSAAAAAAAGAGLAAGVAAASARPAGTVGRPRALHKLPPESWRSTYSRPSRRQRRAPGPGEAAPAPRAPPASVLSPAGVTRAQRLRSGRPLTAMVSTPRRALRGSELGVPPALRTPSGTGGAAALASRQRWAHLYGYASARQLWGGLGHRLLRREGWRAGQGLGAEGQGMRLPYTPIRREGRAGLVAEDLEDTRWLARRDAGCAALTARWASRASLRAARRARGEVQRLRAGLALRLAGAAVAAVRAAVAAAGAARAAWETALTADAVTKLRRRCATSRWWSARAAPGRRTVRLLTAGPARCGRRAAQVQLAPPKTTWPRYWVGACRHRPADIRRRPRPKEATSEVENLTTREKFFLRGWGVLVVCGAARPSVRHLRGWAPQKRCAESTGAPRRKGAPLTHQRSMLSRLAAL